MSEQLQQILNEINSDLAALTKEIEKLVFISPRAALQSIRTMAETLVRQVAEIEKIDHSFLNFGEVQMKLKNEGVVTSSTDNAIHYVRKQGNIASHDGTRKITIREALTCWEYQHQIITWFIETYASADIVVPEYIEPVPEKNGTDSESLLAQIESILQTLTQKKAVKSSVTIEKKISRNIYFKDESIEIPHYLRDAFLLPQRFPKSTTFLIRLNGEQQARIMSELPHQLCGLHQYVKRFKESNDECFFEELKIFVEEEQQRKIIMEKYQGEVLLFYKSDFVILTDALSKIELTKDNFPGQTSLLNSLQEQGFLTVKDLPKELVLLGKYKNVGETALANLFNQLKIKSLDLTTVEI